MDSEDAIIAMYVRLIIDYLHGFYSEDEFIAEVKRLPKLTAPLPFSADSMEITKWD